MTITVRTRAGRRSILPRETKGVGPASAVISRAWIDVSPHPIGASLTHHRDPVNSPISANRQLKFADFPSDWLALDHAHSLHSIRLPICPKKRVSMPHHAKGIRIGGFVNDLLLHFVLGIV